MKLGSICHDVIHGIKCADLAQEYWYIIFDKHILYIALGEGQMRGSCMREGSINMHNTN